MKTSATTVTAISAINKPSSLPPIINDNQYKCKAQYYRIAGNFRGGNIFVVFNNQIYSWKKIVVYSSVLSQLNHKIKSSWVKHSWFYLNHENHEIFSPQKFPAIWYVRKSPPNLQ